MSSDSILVVDDDAPVRRMLERTLAAEGYAVVAVADGGSALAQASGARPDAIVLDVAMPGMDGLAVARRLRSKGVATADPDAHRARRTRRSRRRPRLGR